MFKYHIRSKAVEFWHPQPWLTPDYWAKQTAESLGITNYVWWKISRNAWDEACNYDRYLLIELPEGVAKDQLMFAEETTVTGEPMRPYTTLLEKNWSHCKCRFCKRKKPDREKRAPKQSIRAKLKRLLRKELHHAD